MRNCFCPTLISATGLQLDLTKSVYIWLTSRLHCANASVLTLYMVEKATKSLLWGWNSHKTRVFETNGTRRCPTRRQLAVCFMLLWPLPSLETLSTDENIPEICSHHYLHLSLIPHFPSALIMKLLLISTCFPRGKDKSRGGVSVMYVGVEKETVVEKREWKDWYKYVNFLGMSNHTKWIPYNF